MKNLKQLLTSKRFGVAVAGVLFVILNEHMGLELNMASIISIVGIVIGFIVSQGSADKGKEAAKIRAAGTKAVVASLAQAETWEGAEDADRIRRAADADREDVLNAREANRAAIDELDEDNEPPIGSDAPPYDSSDWDDVFPIGMEESDRLDEPGPMENEESK